MPLQLEYSIHFVTFHWRTSLFSIHHRETPRTTSFREEVHTRLGQVMLPGRTLDAILNMADTIDTFEKELVHPSKTDLVKVLGLGNTKPKVPYDRNLGYLSGKLALVFLCAVIIDRVLWALALNILEPLTRYINDDFPLHVEHLDMAQFAKPMADVAQALAVCEDREVHYPDSLTGDNLRCVRTLMFTTFISWLRHS